MPKIVQITDPHLLPNPGDLLMGLDVWARFESVLRDAAALDPAAYLFTGDFCAHDPEVTVYERLRSRLDALGKPYYIVPGNHDSREQLRLYFDLPGEGNAPVNYSVDVQGRRFIFLDSLDARLGTTQLAWLRQALQLYPAADLVIHHPPFPAGARFMDRKYPLQNPETLAALLQPLPRKPRIFCGHYHSARYAVSDYSIAFLCPPTSFYIHPDKTTFERQELPPGYQVLDYNAGGLRVSPRYVA